MRLNLFLMGFFAASSAYAAPEHPCQSSALAKLDSAACYASDFLYEHGGKEKKGKLIRLSQKDLSKPDSFYLLIEDEGLKNLGSFLQWKRSPLIKCALNDLDFDPAFSGRPEDYNISHIGKSQFVLDNNLLVRELRAVYPFTGVKKLHGDGQCSGNISYAEQVYHYTDGLKLCQQAHREYYPKAPKHELAKQHLYYHIAGIYYLCHLRDANLSNDEARHYYYRIDLEKEGKPGVVLMREATHHQRMRWKWR